MSSEAKPSATVVVRSTPEHETHIAAHLRGQKLFRIAALVVIIFGLRFAEAFLVPMIIGVIIAAVSSPAVHALSRRGLPTVPAAALVLLLDIAVLGGVLRLLLLAASDLQTGLPAYIAKVSALSHSVESYLLRIGLHKVATASWFSAEQASAMLQTFLSELATGASHVALVVFVVFFLLCELGGLRERLRKLSANADVQFERVDCIVRQVQLYLVVKLWTSFLSGLLVYVVLKLSGVELSLFLALCFFLLHFIPNVGAAIGTLMAVVFALVDRGVATAASVGVGLLLINTVVGNLIEPRMLGSRLGVSPFAVLVGMLFWGWLWGPAGALLSVPILAATKIVLENIPDLAWISELADPRGAEPHRDTIATRLQERVGQAIGARAAQFRAARRNSPRSTIPGFPLRGRAAKRSSSES